MEQVQTIVCPNCGAVTASNQNCEYCGSMLTKVASILCNNSDDVKASLKDLGFGKSVYVSNKLLEAVERTIAQCNKHNTVIETHTTITELKFDEWDVRIGLMSQRHKLSQTDRLLLGMAVDDPLSMSIISSSPNNPPVLMLKYYMMCSEVNRSYSHFENISIGELFNKQQVGDFMVCTMELDSDTKTSAQLIKYALKELFGKTDVDCIFNTYGIIDGDKYEISSEKKKEIDKKIEAAEKEYLEAEQRYLNELRKIEKNIERAIMDERATYVRNIKRESILPSFAQIFGMVAILAMGVYWGKMYSLTTALIILGAVIALSMTVKGVSKSRRINEVNDLETFKTKYSKIKASTPTELPQKPKRQQKIYPKYLEE